MPNVTSAPLQDQLHDYKINKSLRGGSRLKGGHLGTDRAVDMFCDSDGSVLEVTAQRVRTRNTHGTGCTLSSAIATLRPGAPDWSSTIAAAKDYLTTALQHADELRIGRVDETGIPLGHGPVHHFAAVWNQHG